MASNSATKLASQQSIKAYVDSQVTAQDLDVTDGTTSISIDLDSEALSVLGGTGVTSTASGNGVTLAIDATVATLTGSQTLSNKTLTTPAITGPLTTDSTIDGRDVAVDGTKLDGIEVGATADQTASEIRTLVEAATDSNVFTDADHTKLNGIEALADVTDTANVTAAGALMDSELTNITAVKALNQGVATTDSPSFVGLTASGEITANGGIALGDNDKATFGASDDLQIYHDGGTSVIADVGTGFLALRGDGNVTLQNAAGTENKLVASSDGAVTVYYDNAAKLATTSTGIDVTGTATMDGLTVDNGIIYSNSTTPDIRLMESDATDQNTQIRNNAGDLQIRTLNDAQSSATLRFNLDHSTGDISFYEDTGTTAKIVWDASEETLFVDQKIKVGNTTDGVVLQTSTGMGSILGVDTGGNGWNALDIRAGSATQLYLNTSGRVGIGTSSPTSRLTVASGTDSTNAGDGIHFFGSSINNQAAIQSFNTGAYDGDLRFYTSDHGSPSTSIGAERMRIDSVLL
jgi:hypothetical protein